MHMSDMTHDKMSLGIEGLSHEVLHFCRYSNHAKLMLAELLRAHLNETSGRKGR